MDVQQAHAKTKIEKPLSEQIVIDVPPIVTEEEFDAVARTLKSRDPHVAAPRTVTGPVLLTGQTFCAICSGAMTMRTGTSKSGKVHTYYACSTCARKGKTACKGQSVPMGKLDALVTDHLAERLFQPDRLAEILTSVATRRAEKALEVDRRVATLRSQVTEADTRLSRLYEMVEAGLTDLDDVLKERIAVLKLERERAKIALDRILVINTPQVEFTEEALEKFGRAMRERISSGAIPFRKAIIQSIVDRIEIDNGVVRVFGDKTVLEHAVTGHNATSEGVRRCVPKWRARNDSNVRPSDS